MRDRFTHTTTSIEIASKAGPIFDMAAAIEHWPEILPHYRRVDILSGNESRRLADMYAWRGWIPITWQAEETIDLETLTIRFHHTHGATAGMNVIWTFEEAADGTRVSIEHDVPGFGPRPVQPFTRWVIAHFFIDYVASRTLARIKFLVERTGQGEG